MDAVGPFLPVDAPITLKAALVGMYLAVLLFVVDGLTTAVFRPSGAVFLLDAVLAVGFLYLAVALGRARNWARWVVAAVCLVLTLSAFTLFASGVGVVQVVGVLQILLFVAIVTLLLLRPTQDWFRIG